MDPATATISFSSRPVAGVRLSYLPGSSGQISRAHALDGGGGEERERLEQKRGKTSVNVVLCYDHVITAARFHRLAFVGRARPLSCPGYDLQGVKFLQSHDDAKEIHASCQGRHVVIIGASFIG